MLQKLLAKKGSAKKRQEEPVCYCFQVYEETILQIIREHKVNSVEELRRYCRAGMGCGTCTFDLEEIIEREKAKRTTL